MTQDLVHALVLEVESADGVERLATEARVDAGYPLGGVVCDLGAGFVQAHHDHFGTLPFQACRVHFDRRLDSDVPKVEVVGQGRSVCRAEGARQSGPLRADIR